MEDARPHYRRFPRIEQEIVWAAIQTLDIADKLTVLRELATEIAAQGVKRGNEYDKMRAAVISLRDAADMLGKSPSQSEYRRLREQLPDLGLVADGTLRRWLGNGSWNACLRRALLDTVSDGDFVTPAKGDRFTETELVTAIRECMADHDDRVPTWPHFVAWARSPDVRARPGRRPLSLGPFHRLGGYRDVLVRNELIAEGETRFDIRGRALPSKWRFTDEELRDAVLSVTRELGRAPREVDYRRARENNNTGVMPSVSALTNRFGGSWASVIETIGLRGHPNAGPDRRAAKGITSPYTRQEMIDALKEAWPEVGEPFSKPAYASWRKAKIAAALDAGETRRIPGVETVCREFGGWPEAVEAALPTGVRTHRRRKTYLDG